MTLEPASPILPGFLENAFLALSFFSAKTYYLWVLSRYLFFSKDEVYPQSIKPIFGLLIATHLFLSVVLTLLVVKP